MKLTVKIALGATLALGLIAAPAGAKGGTTKVPTDVVIEGYKYHMSTGRVVFSGHVDCASKCLSGRKVSLRQVTDGINAGTDMTNSKGDWAISFKATAIQPGKFQAKASQRTIVKRKHGHVVSKTVCEAGKSKKFNAGSSR
ncbi:hypothetical protein BH10ACT11_BH10ACT11_15580 [soil metagenome]